MQSHIRSSALDIYIIPHPWPAEMFKEKYAMYILVFHSFTLFNIEVTKPGLWENHMNNFSFRDCVMALRGQEAPSSRSIVTVFPGIRNPHYNDKMVVIPY